MGRGQAHGLVPGLALGSRGAAVDDQSFPVGVEFEGQGACVGLGRDFGWGRRTGIDEQERLSTFHALVT